jgi:hypothetical protein
MVELVDAERIAVDHPTAVQVAPIDENVVR